jgi:hypothetical protein
MPFYSPSFDSGWRDFQTSCLIPALQGRVAKLPCARSQQKIHSFAMIIAVQIVSWK